jgi:putative ABC transport system permease protein
LLRGRLFSERDEGTLPVAIISESMAKLHFPGEDPIGQSITIAGASSEIVGIVGDVKHHGLDRPSRAQIYEPFAQRPTNFIHLVVRYREPSLHLGAAIRTAISAVDEEQPIASIRPLAELLVTSLARQRFAMFLFAVFSTVALLLAAIGIYGVMAYSVAQRTGEIGIRMALGAQTPDVLRLIFIQGGKLIALGLVIGLAAAIALTRLLSSLLFGVSAHDPMTFATIAALLATVAALACWLPARRATKVDPMIALRAE